MMHCAPSHTNVTAPLLAKILFDNLVRLHGIPDSIVSDRDPKFISKFLESTVCESWRETSYVHVWSSTNGWSDRKGQSDSRSYASKICHKGSGQLGITAYGSWVRLQQFCTKVDKTPVFLNSGTHPQDPSGQYNWSLNVSPRFRAVPHKPFKAEEHACRHLIHAKKR